MGQDAYNAYVEAQEYADRVWQANVTLSNRERRDAI